MKHVLSFRNLRVVPLVTRNLFQLAPQSRGSDRQRAGKEWMVILNKFRSDGVTPHMKRMALCLAVTMGANAGLATAQEGGATEGVYLSGAERIATGDRIRMLSQRISATACLVDAGVDMDKNRQVIADDIAQADGLLAAMKDGDSEIGIDVPEDDRKMLSAIRGVKLQWEPFRSAAELRLQAGVSAQGPDYVSRQNLNLMHASKYLISEVVSRYSIPPALLQSDAFTLQIMARQRSLSQQIAKESCGLLTGNTIMGNEKRLQNAVSRFDVSLTALVNGLQAAGVSPPPSAEIDTGLKEMAADWAALRADLATVTAGNDVPRAAQISEQMDGILRKLEALVPLYVESSKAGI